MPNFFSPDGELPDDTGIPSYLLAADNHNLGNSMGGSWLDPSTWGQKFENGGMLIATGVLSGANSFYNTGVTVGNWFGAGAELNDTKAWISGIDSNMGEYYDKNREAADLVGFIAGSLIPGIGGIKILNAGQTALKAATKTGLIGGNLSRATSLLIPQTERYITLAASDINAASATFSAINTNKTLALASGVYQNVLEGAAFETAVQATMFQSPILSGQDGWDITKNIAMGGLLGGAIGGAFEGAKTLGAIKKKAALFESGGKFASGREIPLEALSADKKIILMTEDKDFGAIPMRLGPDATEEQKAAFAVDTKNYKDRQRRIDNDVRTQVHKLTGDDGEMGNMVADSIYGQDSKQVMDNILGTDGITRLSGTTKVEKEIAALAKEGQTDSRLGVQYVKLTGEGAGEVSDAAPRIMSLADRVVVREGQSTTDAVLGAVRKEKNSLDQNWNASTLKGSAAHLKAEARYIWADKLLKEIPDEALINQYDIPVLERALKDGQTNISIVNDTGAILKKRFASQQELMDHLKTAKTDVANIFVLRNVYRGGKNALDDVVGTDSAAKIANTKVGRLEGQLGNDSDDFFAWQSANKDYQKYLEAKGKLTPTEQPLTPAAPHQDTRFLPTYGKLGKRLPGEMADADGNLIDGMTWIKTQQTMLQDSINNVFAKNAAAIADSVPVLTDAQLLNSNKFGAGASLLGFANAGYNTAGAIVQLMGSLTNKLKVNFRQTTQDTIEGLLANVGRDQKASVEWATINQKVSRMAKPMVRYTDEDTGTEYLVTKDALRKYSEEENLTTRYDENIVKGEMKFNVDEALDGAPEELIALENESVVQLADAHIARSGARTQSYRELRAAQGLTDEKDPEVFRPIRPNPKDYPHFAFVKDPRVTGQGHTTMIFANDEAKLGQLIDKVPKEYQVLTKKDTEDFFKARGDYEYQRTLHENYIDSDLKSRGIFSDFFTQTDPQKIVNDILQQHLREDDVLAMELMRAKNQKAFSYWEDQGDAYTKLSASKFGTYNERLEAAGKNPYLDYIKTALDISKASEHPLLYGFNTFLDKATSRAYGAVSEAFNSWKTPLDEGAMTEINSLIDHYGMNTGYRDAATNLLVNHPAPKGVLTKFVRGANAVLSKLILGLDPLNSVTNFVGANILRSTELKQITDAIKAGDTDLAGEMAKLSKIDLPGGVGTITSPSKIVASSLKNFTQDLFSDDRPLLERYKKLGVIKDASEQFKSIIDDFSLRGTETVSDLNSRLSRAFVKAKDLTVTGEKITGNKFAEELNRFISADSIRQLTDPGVSRGLITRAEQDAYINTFVNRVEGNTLASQRPLMFQGPIGQAVGLFQTYQFNLMQQMFRYVAEGSAKDSAMLLGLQGTFFGIQGLPAFQFINQHVVGTLSGNQKHTDLYDTTYGVVGKQVGNLLLYGLPSNLLQTNLYSRGDINPRNVTILPTTLPDVPFIGAFGKFLGSVKGTVDKIAVGGNVWESMLQGLEHNGLSRPMAGLAQTLQSTTGAGVPFSTTNKGGILGSNDLMSWATASRLTGGRPLDEAIINDGVFRIQSYKQYDQAKLDILSEAIKASTIKGQTMDGDQIGEFAKEYVYRGGKQANFNKYMMNEYKAANVSQAEKIQTQLANPFAQKMQLLMGGSLEDLSSPNH